MREKDNTLQLLHKAAKTIFQLRKDIYTASCTNKWVDTASGSGFLLSEKDIDDLATARQFDSRIFNIYWEVSNLHRLISSRK